MESDDRFFAKVCVADSGCHLWAGAQNVWGYGRLKRGGKTFSAHRVAWELANGPIPEGLFVLHRCDNRACVNPEHLFLGTQRDNVRDMVVKGRGKYLRNKGANAMHGKKLGLGDRPVTVRFEPELHTAIEQAATREHRSLSGQIRHIVAAALERHGEERADSQNGQPERPSEPES
jgi:hypothetical protein